MTISQALYIIAGVIFLLAFLLAGGAISAEGDWFAPQPLGYLGLTFVAFGLVGLGTLGRRRE